MRFGGEEGRRDPVTRGLRDAAAVVVEVDSYGRHALAGTEIDAVVEAQPCRDDELALALRHRLERVTAQVEEHLHQPVAIGEQFRDRGVEAALDVRARAEGIDGQQVQHVVEHAVQVHGCDLDLPRASEHQEIVEHGGDPIDLTQDQLGGRSIAFAAGALAEDLRGAADAAEGIAHLVRDARRDLTECRDAGTLALDLAQRGAPRAVRETDYGAVDAAALGTERRDRRVDQQIALEASRDADLVLDAGGTPSQHGAQRLAEGAGAGDLLDRATRDRLGGGLEDATRLGIHVGDASGRIDDDDTIEEGVEDLGKTSEHGTSRHAGGRWCLFLGHPSHCAAARRASWNRRASLAPPALRSQPMRTNLSADDALRTILAAAGTLEPETCPSADALGRVLAEPVLSSRTLPPFDVSAMDGYALRAADLAGATPEAPVALPVAFEVAAGARPDRAIAVGESARIFTGAPLPPGADAVVRQEEVARAGAHARFGIPVAPGENVREAGEDVRAGDRVLEAGARLGPGPIGMLAALGRSVVAVHRRPRVAILSGGDELIEPDGDPAGGRIVSSNSYSIAAQCREAGAESTYLGIARDTPEDLERVVRAGLWADVLVSSAGVSVGDHDYVRPVLERLGCELVFWGVEIRPGFPLVFGRFPARGSLVFGLPGNPVSAMVTFEEFVRPVLRKLAGHRALHRPRIEAVLGETLRKGAGRMHFVRVRLERSDGRIVAWSTGSQSSGVLRSMALAHGLLVFPAEATSLAEGTSVPVRVLDEEFLAAEDAGF